MRVDQRPTVDLAAIDFSKLVAGPEQIQANIPHRGDMLLLDGVVLVDPGQKLIVGFKDARPDEFWVKGHFPKFAVMPGVLMCEAAAQLTSYYMYDQKIVKPDQVIGLGGIDESRFRGLVRPGDRLALVGYASKATARMTRFAVTGYVARAGKFDVVFETTLLGVSLGTFEDLLRA